MGRGPAFRVGSIHCCPFSLALLLRRELICGVRKLRFPSDGGEAIGSDGRKKGRACCTRFDRTTKLFIDKRPHSMASASGWSPYPLPVDRGCVHASFAGINRVGSSASGKQRYFRPSDSTVADGWKSPPVKIRRQSPRRLVSEPTPMPNAREGENVCVHSG
ncbi:hypothetical protein NL676_033699 [Syzygium grande]|nr:hypothetical protein NL676_033699 [Syzygium grande]